MTGPTVLDPLPDAAAVLHVRKTAPRSRMSIQPPKATILSSINN
jgi:hypothetical protein